MQINQFLKLAQKHKIQLETKLAHSGGHDEKRGIIFPDQLYEEHVLNVVALTVQRVESMQGIDPVLREQLLYVARRAAEYHDLGKLDPLFQLLLHKIITCKSPINHVDAGVAYLVSTGLSLDYIAALLVLAHHKPLGNLSKLKFSSPPLREYDPSDNRLNPEEQVARTDAMLESYLLEHNKVVNLDPIKYPENDVICVKLSVFIRMTLSCLVSADHDDTGDHYGNPYGSEAKPVRCKDRLVKLDEYVSVLSDGSDRSNLRKEFYKVHRYSDIDAGIVYTDGVVGSGKTTAMMANALKRACNA